MEKEIQLGDTVKCIHTGFIGVVIYKTEFVNKCIQFGVAPKVGKDNKPPEEIGIDSQSLRVVNRGERGKEIDREIAKKRNEEKQSAPTRRRESTGGPMTRGLKMRGF